MTVSDRALCVSEQHSKYALDVADIDQSALLLKILFQTLSLASGRGYEGIAFSSVFPLVFIAITEL